MQNTDLISLSMPDQFELPVKYKGEQHFFKAILNVYGYTHKFQVDVNGETIIFEPDEERNYRAVLDYDKIENNKNIDVDLLQIIAKCIEVLMK